jgi:hypothetical protein
MKKPKPTPAQVLATAKRMYSDIAALCKKRGHWKAHWKDDLGQVDRQSPEADRIVLQWRDVARWHLTHGGKP